MNTAFKPNLENYGRVTKGRISAKKVLGITIALPLGTAWMIVLMPFVKGYFWWRI